MKILVLCTGNSCRSQMAHGFLEHYAGDRALVYSAGVETHGVNPDAVKYMMEAGIDISHHTSNNVTEYAGMDFDYIITVCDNALERCPFFPGNAIRLHRDFPDPSKLTGDEAVKAAGFREARDMIRDYCRDFVNSHF